MRLLVVVGVAIRVELEVLLEVDVRNGVNALVVLVDEVVVSVVLAFAAAPFRSCPVVLDLGEACRFRSA